MAGGPAESFETCPEDRHPALGLSPSFSVLPNDVTVEARRHSLLGRTSLRDLLHVVLITPRSMENGGDMLRDLR